MSTNTGWGNPKAMDSRSKFHYFKEDGRSLCNKWANIWGLISLEEGHDDHGDNCAECKRRKAKLSGEES